MYKTEYLVVQVEFLQPTEKPDKNVKWCFNTNNTGKKDKSRMQRIS